MTEFTQSINQRLQKSGYTFQTTTPVHGTNNPILNERDTLRLPYIFVVNEHGLCVPQEGLAIGVTLLPRTSKNPSVQTQLVYGSQVTPPQTHNPVGDKTLTEVVTGGEEKFIALLKQFPESSDRYKTPFIVVTSHGKNVERIGYLPDREYARTGEALAAHMGINMKMPLQKVVDKIIDFYMRCSTIPFSVSDMRR